MLALVIGIYPLPVIILTLVTKFANPTWLIIVIIIFKLIMVPLKPNTIDYFFKEFLLKCLKLDFSIVYAIFHYVRAKPSYFRFSWLALTLLS